MEQEYPTSEQQIDSLYVLTR